MSIHGKDAVFKIEDGAATTLRDISPYVNSVDFSQENDNHDDTTYGAEGHTFRNGLTNGTITVSGIWDKTANVGSETVFQSLVGIEVSVGWEWGPEGSTTGLVKRSGECVLTSYAESAPVADLVTFTATLQITGSVTVGTWS